MSDITHLGRQIIANVHIISNCRVQLNNYISKLRNTRKLYQRHEPVILFTCKQPSPCALYPNPESGAMVSPESQVISWVITRGPSGLSRNLMGSQRVGH